MCTTRVDHLTHQITLLSPSTFNDLQKIPTTLGLAYPLIFDDTTNDPSTVSNTLTHTTFTDTILTDSNRTTDSSKPAQQYLRLYANAAATTADIPTYIPSGSPTSFSLSTIKRYLGDSQAARGNDVLTFTHISSTTPTIPILQPYRSHPHLHPARHRQQLYQPNRLLVRPSSSLSLSLTLNFLTTLPPTSLTKIRYPFKSW
jgi:hypothetical protein